MRHAVASTLAALVAGPISDAAVTQVGVIAVALVSAGVAVANQRARARAAREGRLERRREQKERRVADTLADAQRQVRELTGELYDERLKRVRVEERLERVLAQYHLPSAAGRSGEYPPYVPPTPPVPTHPIYRPEGRPDV